MVGGVALAAAPPSILAIGGQTLSVVEAGVLTVGITAGTFLGQLTSAILVEAPLARPDGSRRVAIPLWVSAIGVLGSIGMAIASGLGGSAVWVLAVATTLVLVALETGRAVGVAEGYEAREIVSAVTLGSSLVAGLGLALLGEGGAFICVGIGAGVTLLVRAVGAPHRSDAAPLRTRLWIAGDVGITGVVFPLLNAAVLGLLGPAAAYLFGAVSTVSGLLAIPLNFMRVRLLRSPERAVVGLTVGLMGTAAAAIAIAQLLGVFDILFGDGWAHGRIALPLVAACMWRAASILTTLPFAAIRRRGEVRLLWVLRTTCSAATALMLLALVPFGSLTWIFVGFLAGELLQAVVYAVADRRLAAADRSGTDDRVRVLVDLLFMTGRRGGMETYVREVYSRLRPEPGIEFTALASRELARGDTSWFPGRVLDSGARTSRASGWLTAEMLRVSGVVRRMGADVVHAPANIAPRTGAAPLVVTIHDVIALELPELLPSPRSARVLAILLRRAARRARTILTVSEASASAIVKTLDVPPGRIRVTPLAAAPSHADGVDRPRGRSVLVPGNRMPHKNVERLLEAIASLPVATRPDVVITGGGGEDDPLNTVVERLGLTEHVRIAGWVSPAALDELYSEAGLVVLPTLYEGFGLPVLEAMRRGIPVACSDIPVLREVGGEAALYFDPFDIRDIAGTIDSALADPARRRDLGDQGRVRAARFSWEATAAATRAALIAAAGRPREDPVGDQSKR